MATLKGILATTHVDRHGDMLTRGALEDAVDQLRSRTIPFGYNHDPRIPPLGRIIDASLVQLEDGEWGLEGTIELFEPGVPIARGHSSRAIPLNTYSSERLHVVYDRSHHDADDTTDIVAIGKVLGTAPQEEAKKALEPLSVLTIAGAFLLGQILSGFLGRVGEDGYEILKARLKGIFNRRPDGQDRLLKFEAVVRVANRDVTVEAILTNPTEHDVDRLTEILKELDSNAKAVLDARGMEDVRRLVFEYKDASLHFSFAVRDDAVPLDLRRVKEPDDA